MSSTYFGFIFLFLFAVSQGVRDAYFGNIFQTYSFLYVAVMAFSLAGAVFLSLSWLRRPQDLRLVVSNPRQLIALNVATAAAWLLFLFGLRHLEPAVVAALYNGVGPLVVLAAAWLGWNRLGSQSSWLEKLCYFGIALTLLLLILVVLTDRSGMSSKAPGYQIAALISVVVGGAMITISYFITRWFTDVGAGSDAVMGCRFLITLVAAAILEITLGNATARPDILSLPFIAAAAFVLIVIPSFLVQLGVSRTSPLAANIFRALGPVFVFAVQQADGRLKFSGATLACIIAFCIFTICAAVLRAWTEARD